MGEMIIQHASSVWEDIVWNGDVNVVSKLQELPSRRCVPTVPTLCEGFYARIWWLFCGYITSLASTTLVEHARLNLRLVLFLGVWSLLLGSALI
jgi:hypothetical protein